MDALANRLRRSLLAIPGLVESDGIFDDGPAFFMDSKQIARIDGHAIEIRLTRPLISERRAALKADPRVDRRRPSSNWIVVTCARPSDVAFAAELARIAADAHRPPPGVPMRPPPTGADLERRRRFH